MRSMSAHAIATARLRLAPVRPEELRELHALLADETVRRYLCDGRDLGAPRIAETIESSIATFETHGLGLWAARLEGETRISGLVGYAEFADPGVLEIMYAMFERCWGRGLASEMTRAVMERGYARGLDELHASTDAPNEASVRVLERLGFVEVRRAPADPPHTLWEQVYFLHRPREKTLDSGRAARHIGSE